MNTYKLKYFGIVLLLIAVAFSCGDEDKQLFDDFQKGAIPIFAQEDDDTGILNYNDPSAMLMSFTVDKDGLGEVESIDITATYNNTETGEAETVVITNVSSLPAHVTITTAQLLDAFDEEVLTLDSLTLADAFVIGGAMKMSDGRYLNGGYSPSVFSKNPVTLTYNVTCVSAIPLGAYVAVTNATSTDGCPPTNPLVNHTVNVTLSAPGAGVYRVSDFFGGAYISWYGACYGYSFATPANFTDVCDDLSFSFADGFGAAVEGTGSYNSATGVITYTWENEFGDTGTTTLTPD